MGKRFPFVYRLAVESLRQTHPDWRITVHYSDPPNNEDWKALARKAEMRPLDDKALLEALPSSLAGVADVYRGIADGYPAGRSNVLRYLILLREGGIYIDFDTLTLRSFEPLTQGEGFIGEETVFRSDDDRVSGKAGLELLPYGTMFGLSYGLSYANTRWFRNRRTLNKVDGLIRKGWSARKLNNAVLGASANHPFFASALARIPQIDPKIRFALGPMLMNQVWDANGGQGITRLNEKAFYVIPPSQTFRFFQGPAPVLPPDVFTLHWCSSNHKEWAAKLNPKSLVHLPKPLSLYPKLALEVIERGI